MTTMRFAFVLVILSVLSVLLMAGCAAPEQQAPVPANAANLTSCHNVTEDVPEVQEKCEDVTLTSEVCSEQKLEYSTEITIKKDLCLSDSGCAGLPLSQCSSCKKASTKCVFTVFNNDNRSGAWKIGATFQYRNYTFTKDPVSKEISPHENGTFEFTQSYDDSLISISALCSMNVVDEASANLCYQVAKKGVQCENVTVTKTVEKQVCG